MSSLAGLKKKFFNFPQKVLVSAILPTFKVDFLNVQAKFQKILGEFPGGGSQGQFGNFSAFYFQKGGVGLAVLQVDIFQNP